MGHSKFQIILEKISKQLEIVSEKIQTVEAYGTTTQPKKISKKCDLKKGHIVFTIAGMIGVLGIFLGYKQYNKSRKNQGYNKIVSNSANKML